MGLSLNDENRRCDAVAKKTTFKNYLKTITYEHANCTLTSNAESKTGTAGHDTFLAVNVGELTSNDVVDGGAGTDTIRVAMNNNATLRPLLTSLEKMIIEQVEASAGATTGTLNLDLSTGVTSVEVKNVASTNNSEDTFVVSGVTTSTSLKITDDLASGNRDNNFTMTYSGVSGTADVASVEINSNTSAATLGTITVAGVETLTASSTGGAGATYTLTAVDATTATINASAKSGGTVTAGDLTKVTTLNVNAADDLAVNDNTNKLIKVSTVNVNSQTADKTVTLTSLTTTATASATDAVVVNVIGAGKASISIDTNFDTQSATNADTVTVNAATNSGGVSFTTSATAANKVTGGTGNDTVTLGAALDKNDVIALGGGTADSLVTSMTFNTTNAVTGAYYSDSLATADLPTISGVEVARINLALDAATPPAAGTGAMSAKTASFASTLEINGAAAVDIGNVDITINNIGAGQKVKIGSNLDLDSGVVILTLADATGATDSLTVTTDGLNQTATATFEGITAAGVETVSVDLASTTAENTTIAAGTLTFADATSVTLTGSKITTATVDAKDGATIDASAVTGTLELTPATADKYTVKGSATKATKFIMSTGLNNDDTIVGGSATTDSLTATINGLTATTGALKITGVETVELTTDTAASTVNTAGIVGATKISVGADQNATLTNLAAGVNLQLGTAADATYDNNKTLTASLADATGSSDAITVDLIERGGNGAVAANLVIAGVETVTINDLAAAGTNDDVSLAVASVAASKLVITGSYSTEVLDLTTDGNTGSQKLNAATTQVDATGFKGILTASAATNTGTTFTARGIVGTITGGAAGDTVIIGSTANYINASVGTVDAGSGSDTVTVYLGGSSASLDSVTNAETLNINLDAVAGFSFNAGGGADATITAATVNYFGGKAGEVYTASATLTDVAGRLIDASALAGSVAVVFGDDGLLQTNVSDTVTIKGGQGALDKVTISMSNSNTGEFTMSGVETLVVGNDTGASTVDLKNVTGLTTLVVTDDGATATDITVENARSGMTLQVGVAGGADFASATVDVNLTSTSATTDSINIDLVLTATALTVDTAGIETVNIRAKAGAATSATDVITIAGTVTGGTINVSGEDADDEVTLSGVSAGYTTINAATLNGDLSVAASARGSAAMTITGGLGSDTIAMENAADVLDGGTKASDNDTMVVSFSGTGGALIVDLSSSTDQVQMFNGLANAAVQKNFESVNASAYTQTNSVGSDITGSSGANTITGTAYADTIRAGDGGDAVYGGDAADAITAGEGIDAIYGGTGADTIDLTETTQAVDTLYLTNGESDMAIVNNLHVLTGLDVVTGVRTGDKVDLVSLLAANGAALTVALKANAAAKADTATGVADGTYATILNGAVTGWRVVATEVGSAATTTVDTLEEILDLLDGGTAGNVVAFNFGSDGYVFVENGAVDHMVKLVGVSVASLANASEVIAITLT
jgi:hypothetical protein